MSDGNNETTSRDHWLEYLRRSGGQDATFRLHRMVYGLGLPADAHDRVISMVRGM